MSFTDASLLGLAPYSLVHKFVSLMHSVQVLVQLILPDHQNTFQFPLLESRHGSFVSLKRVTFTYRNK